jgi:hypothetical protein
VLEFLALVGLADQVRIVEDAIHAGAGMPTLVAMPG